ncbi:MAG: carboxymuconolactone decarboxylase family protein [Ilumatobacteraceae bacterium]
MTQRLSLLDRDALSDEQGELWDGLTASRRPGLDLFDDDGHLVGPFNAWLHVPKIGRRLSSLGAHLRFETSIERRLSEIAICTVGAHWRSEFEFFAHAPMALEHGVDQSVIDALRAGSVPSFDRSDEETVYAVSTQLLNDRRVDTDTYRAAEGLLGEAGMVELVALIGYYCLISMLLNLFEVPLPGDAKPNWA